MPGLTLPSHLWSRDPESLFRLAKQIGEVEGQIELDCQHLRFIDPLGFAVLGATLGPLDGEIQMPWLDASLAKYMERMDFFHHCRVEGYSGARSKDALREQDLWVELTRLSDLSQVDQTASRLAAAITGKLTRADPSDPIDMATGHNKFSRFAHPLQYSLSELLGNALTHARRDDHIRAAVWVAAQVDRVNNIVKFSVVDNGCGMLGSLRKHSRLTSPAHDAAIRLALEPRVSCNRDGEAYNEHGNQGVGLTTTSRIASAAGGYLTITSGDSCISTGEVPDHAPMTDSAFWNGVAVSFECRRGRLPAVRIAELLPPVIPADIPIEFS